MKLNPKKENPISKLVYKYPEYFQHNKDKFFNLDNKNVHFVDEAGIVYDRKKCQHFYDLYHDWNLEGLALFIHRFELNM